MPALKAWQRAIYVNGKPQELDPFTRDKMTYTPIASIMPVLARLGIASAWNGKVWSIATPQ